MNLLISRFSKDYELPDDYLVRKTPTEALFLPPDQTSLSFMFE